MRKLLAACGFVLLAGIAVVKAGPFPTISQDVGVCDPNNPANCIAPDASGNVPVVINGSGSGTTQVVGNVASGATDTGNPVKIGAKYNATLPTFADGQRGDIQIGTRGSANVTLYGPNSTTPITVTSLQDASANGIAPLAVNSFGSLYNSSTWERQRSIIGAVAAGTGTTAVAIAPNNQAAGGVPISSSSALAANQVVCSAACNLYSLQVSADSTLSGAAWWVMIYDATAAPADGAVTPVKCYAMASGSTTFSTSFPTPVRFSTGAVIGVSTTGCFTKTASVHAFVSGDARQ